MQQHFIYINLDGFAKYYYDTLQDRAKRLPNLSALMEQGVSFPNAYTGTPSITFPMQCAIVSGGYSDITGNCDQSWDKSQQAIVPHRRRNNAQTVGELCKQLNIPFVSIQQFALENKGATQDDKDALYVQPGGDYRTRFAVLMELLTQHQITTPTAVHTYNTLPRAIFLYIDDLDTIGHNGPKYYAFQEEQRVAHVQKRLCEIDEQLGVMIEALKQNGIYDATTILLTTDHGMISYHGPSKLPDIQAFFEKQGFADVRMCTQGPVNEPTPDVVLTAHDIQCQVYFNEPVCEAQQQAWKTQLLALPVVDQVLTTSELVARGVSPQYGDMVISPVEGACLNAKTVLPHILYATHDSLHEKCQHIFAVLKGPAYKQNYVAEQCVHNIDFFPTILHAFSLPPLANSTGDILTDILL